MSKLDQRGVIHLLVPLILLAGIIGGVYLITAGPLKLFPKASVSGPIGGVTYVDTKIGCGNPQGLTPDQICQQKGFVGAVAVDYQTAAKGYWWRQCGGASVSNCDRLNCKINELDCTNTAGYWGSQQPYPENFTRAGTPTTVYKPADFDIQTCSGYSPGWTMRVACSLSGGISGPITPTPSPTSAPSPSPSQGKPVITERAFRWQLTPTQGSTTCRRGDVNCFYQAVIIPTNRTDRPLYNTTFYTSNPQNALQYMGFDGQWTTGNSTTDRIIQPGQGAINTLVKLVPSRTEGTWTGTLYIDGQTCNTPPDCYYYGASSLTITINFVDEASPSPTPVACTVNDLRTAFFSRRGEPKYNPACDINNDGRISVTDYSALLRNLRR